MIKVSRFNESELVVNAELIETIEATPDTIITLTTGRKIVVHESVDDVVQRVMSYRRAVGFQVTLPPGQGTSTSREV